jgi:Fic family protein
MSAFFERYKQEYVDRLLRVSTAGDWEGWVVFFLRGVAESATQGLRLTEELLALRERYHGTVRAARSSGLLGTLIDELFRVPSITISRTAELLAVTPAAASYNLRKLVSLDIVSEVSGRPRGQIVLAKEILDFVGRDFGTARMPPG